VLTDVLKRLQATGQIEYSGEFVIDWVTPETLGEREKAEIEVMRARAEYLLAQTEAGEFRSQEAGPEAGLGTEGGVASGESGFEGEK